ncbi:sugar/nucleoside kinase (ribokinase family) [Kribbella sp. VKM Ac-2527]|uniref:Sugar/nucleoside kinase (Ribokinase family) n=1 Tax=Kribbella caucasensis TaxID=2512215 RepID=A0A4R6JI71_9ACTN|nr:carbohydrate kinase family protein [Kribbella sp. VKM Ac-2527]TDO35830.1 sugar/nucleoside kinase (ribokinase family) [Kribbella sp. VKM Ac-2527]
MELDVFVIGGVGVDTIVRVPSLPLEDVETIHVQPIESYVGHTGHGVVLGCHLLGLRTGLVDVIGDDLEGRQIRRLYEDLGIPFAGALHPSGTRRAVNLVAPDGRRLSLYDGRHPPNLKVDPDLWRMPILRSRHVHVSIMDFARQALPDLSAAGCTVSTDLHDWDGHNPYHQDFAMAADVVFVSAAALPDDAIEWIFKHGRAEAVVVMAGADGSYLYARGLEPVHVPPVQLADRPVVDSNGAGDAYVAAFLTTWLDGDSWERAAAAGSIAGAWACGSAGTHTDLITAEGLAALRRE